MTTGDPTAWPVWVTLGVVFLALGVVLRQTGDDETPPDPDDPLEEAEE